MGMNIETEIAKASATMARYRMSQDDQVLVIKTLLNAGIEHCLNEQERLRVEKEAMIEHASADPIYRRLPN